eukprot:COSAG04_NODE_2095_length_4809_cov_1.849894_2_plen_58_part_00
MRIVSPLLWSRFYSLGSARGSGQVFHIGVAGACLLQLVLSLFAKLDSPAERPREAGG